MTDTLRSSADGWRGRIGTDFSPLTAGRLATAALDVLAAEGPLDRVLVSHDGRRGGAAAADRIAAAVVRKLGRPADRTRWLPTPVASAAVMDGRYDLALLVTASHNPAGWNGVKLKYGRAGSLGPRLEAEIDRQYAAAVSTDLDPAVPASSFAPDALIETHLRTVLDRVGGPVGQPWTVVVDGLNGIAGPALVRLAELLGWTVHPVGQQVEQDFGGLVPDPTLPASRQRLADTVVDTGADFGLVLDGDGDRIFLATSDGQTVQAGELFALLLAQHYRDLPELPTRTIAVTTTTTSQPGRVAAEHGGQVELRPVGFKNMAESMAAGRLCAAGGSVGDLAFARYGRDRDPCVVVALLARTLAAQRISLDQAVAGLRARYGRRHRLEASASAPAGPVELAELARAVLAGCGLALPVRSVGRLDGVRLELPDDQWLAVRRSTTEQLVRVYAEFAAGPSTDQLTDQRLQAALVAALDTEPTDPHRYEETWTHLS